MPPYLHPRSGMTTSLFTTTLAVSFLVVGVPHILPCPVNSKQFADSESDAFDADVKRARRRERKRLRQLENEGKSGSEGSKVVGESNEGAQDVDTLSHLERGRRRECPVPKPGGLIGEIMGFRKKSGDELPPMRTVKVESVQSRKHTQQKESDE